MAFLRAFGSYLPDRVVTNAEIGAMTGSSPEWIFNVSGIEERRFAAEDETVAGMGAKAARACLARAGVTPSEIGLILVASGTSERRFPGPAASVASLLGLDSTPAIDLPLASAGALFGLALAPERFGEILVVAAEKMSAVVMQQPLNPSTSVLFGDGAGACLVSRDAGIARIVDSVIHTDGAYAGDLKLEFGAALEMNGRSVILHASRKIPGAIAALLERNGRGAAEVTRFIMHQANQNLIDRVAAALDLPSARFYSNIRRYGNTSSASMLIAADEWQRESGFEKDRPAVFAAFGAGYHWGALLAEGC